MRSLMGIPGASRDARKFRNSSRQDCALFPLNHCPGSAMISREVLVDLG